MSDTKLGTPSRNRLLTASTCLTTLLESKANNETTAPSNNPNVFLSKNVKDITSLHAAAFSEARHTPGLAALGANLVAIQMDMCDGRIFLQRLGQGLEAATDQGLRLVPELYRSKMLKSRLLKT